MKAAAALVLILAAGCAGQDYPADLIASIRCKWSHKHGQCFCVAGRQSVGYMAWAPPETCKDRP